MMIASLASTHSNKNRWLQQIQTRVDENFDNFELKTNFAIDLSYSCVQKK